MRKLNWARGAWVASASVAVVAIVASSIAQAATQDTAQDTSAVTRGDLVETMSWSGELAYANATTLEYQGGQGDTLSLIHISEPTRLRRISYAVFCLKKK